VHPAHLSGRAFSRKLCQCISSHTQHPASDTAVLLGLERGLLQPRLLSGAPGPSRTRQVKRFFS
jgi:hypothetical protein